MARTTYLQLSRREREIMDILYRRGEASAAEVLEAMSAPPGYSAVRALLRLLEAKGHVRHREDGRKYVFSPCLPRAAARRSAVRHLLRTFFRGSVEDAVASLLDLHADKLSDADLARLAELIEKARRKD